MRIVFKLTVENSITDFPEELKQLINQSLSECLIDWTLEVMESESFNPIYYDMDNKPVNAKINK